MVVVVAGVSEVSFGVDEDTGVSLVSEELAGVSGSVGSVTSETLDSSGLELSSGSETEVSSGVVSGSEGLVS